jgi:SRSO17 transposase
MLEQTFEAGARPAWVVADAVYGADSKLRFFLEERHQPYVLAVASNQCVWVELTQARVKTLAAQLPAEAWRRLTVGAGAKGPRRFEWARVPINQPYDARRWQRWLLVRRSCDNPEDLAFYLAFGPAGTSLEGLARVAGRRSRHRGGLCPRQRRSGPGSVRGALLDRLAPAHDAGPGGLDAPGANARPALCPPGLCWAGDGGV